MSAAEIIEQIKRLPPEEKQVVRNFVIESPQGDEGSVRDPAFQAAADEVFSKYDNLLRKLAQ